jgi:hypothetical protein
LDAWVEALSETASGSKKVNLRTDACDDDAGMAAVSNCLYESASKQILLDVPAGAKELFGLLCKVFCGAASVVSPGLIGRSLSVSEALTYISASAQAWTAQSLH